MLTLSKRISWVGLTVILSGCSSLSSIYSNGEGDYRLKEAEIAKQLEMPPNFVMPGQTNGLLTQSLPDSTSALAEQAKIPSYQVDGVSLKSNLVERWLEFDQLDSKQVWQIMKDFLKSQGYQIETERTDLGWMQTNYQPRKELAPVEQELGKLALLLNKWRPEMAAGIYDRFTVQVLHEDSRVKVLFRHHMMQADSSGDGTSWRIRPYEPFMETLALYQALTYVGMTANQAVAEIETSVYYQEIEEGEELAGLLLNAGLSQSWDYLQSMVFRANWQVLAQDKTRYEVRVKTPENLQAKEGFFKSLFASERLPTEIRLRLSKSSDNEQQSLLLLSVAEGEKPLTAENRQRVFAALGLLIQSQP
jgi:outer membrane protein assembly factor BamC